MSKHTDSQKQKDYTSNWHQSALEISNGEYHIVHDGILNRNDYSLLFEGEEGKRHIPIEATKQLNVYADVQISPAVFSLLSKHGIRVAFFNNVGNLQGFYAPAGHDKTSNRFLEQCRMYDHPLARLAAAREFECASIANMLSNLLYYARRGKQTNSQASTLRSILDDLKECRSVNALMACEARARVAYYAAFDQIIEGSSFVFGKRSKRPPRNEINAMISFGNSMLYNKFLQIIWRSHLDPRIGVVHATNDRPSSLNLDFADVFKPLVVDRVIFSVANRHEMSVEEHFWHDGQAVLLNDTGRQVFIEKIEQKLSTEITVRDDHCTYESLMRDEVKRFQDLLGTSEIFAPYHYN